MSPDLIRDLGLPVALVVALTVFLIRGVWPWATKQTEIAQNQARDAIQALGGLKDTLIQQTEINRQVVELLRQIKEKR